MGEHEVMHDGILTLAPLSRESSPSSVPAASRPSFDSPAPVVSSLPSHSACSCHMTRHMT